MVGEKSGPSFASILTDVFILTSVGHLQCTLVDKPLSLIESLMSRKANEFSEIFQVYFRAG